MAFVGIQLRFSIYASFLLISNFDHCRNTNPEFLKKFHKWEKILRQNWNLEIFVLSAKIIIQQVCKKRLVEFFKEEKEHLCCQHYVISQEVTKKIKETFQISVPQKPNLMLIKVIYPNSVGCSKRPKWYHKQSCPNNSYLIFQFDMAAN